MSKPRTTDTQNTARSESDARVKAAASRARADLLLIFEELWSELDGAERDEISHVRFLLGEIEDGEIGGTDSDGS